MVQQLEEALGIKPEDNTIRSQVPATIHETSSNKDHIEDYEFTRKTQRELYRLGFSSLSELAELARETSDVKYFQVLSMLLKSMNDVSSSVVESAKTNSEVELNKSKLGIQKENIINGSISQTNQTIFIGNSKDLDDFLENNDADINTIENIIIENAEK